MNSFLLKSSKHNENEFIIKYAPLYNEDSYVHWNLNPAGGFLNLSESYITFTVDLPTLFTPDNWFGPNVSI